jgi:hypothetical protein
VVVQNENEWNWNNALSLSLAGQMAPFNQSVAHDHDTIRYDIAWHGMA